MKSRFAIDFEQHPLLMNSPWVRTKISRIISIFFIGAFLFMFLPWTQNIQADGAVTTLLPNQRPQEVQTIIGGRIEKWYVREGDFVKKGDTIIKISEIKDSYLDPGLLAQTNTQIDAKEKSMLSYGSKVDAINSQIEQLEINRDLKQKQSVNKLQQEELKLKAEKADFSAARISADIARQQFVRDSILQKQGVKSPLDVENRRVKWQETVAKLTSADAKVRSAEAAVENAKFEVRNVTAEYSEKLSKAESDRYSALSAQMESAAEVSKLRNAYSNYSIRQGFYLITAPQDGLVTKTLAQGLGETIKEGMPVCTIMPANATKAVEMYVQPVDMPLVHKGSYVRFVFDGWPTIVFSGWPQLSYGTFSGNVFAIDNTPSANGKFRVLVAPADKEKPWPDALKVGTGSHAYLLMKDVPVWYEIWRQLNGFPADYYINKNEATPAKKGSK
ncbi:MAG: HlyD family efflux transporter periplasmic adaptor subunit [Bacteroidetes bacterium]|nr:HlyD family efflux transporter periplasmic adaptor subunit [Bacteroidota bacterium]